ncbi:hypothetical protein [Pelomonas sp. BJYL3]|uniref:hypothetical protein n=1 Tax=Pelomonas sp. BJYL3 TaxID=2976697 RepID=UPI0022B4B784|nr:hypothetical protein [Pelomonas sp. BJYL3]
MTKTEVFEQLFSAAWPRPAELVQYAKARHGFGGDDGYYGVTYPSDLDDYQREVEGEHIPEGSVEVHYWDGAFRDLLVPEYEFLEVLYQHLVDIGQAALAAELRDAYPVIAADPGRLCRPVG